MRETISLAEDQEALLRFQLDRRTNQKLSRSTVIHKLWMKTEKHRSTVKPRQEKTIQNNQDQNQVT